MTEAKTNSECACPTCACDPCRCASCGPDCRCGEACDCAKASSDQQA